MRLEQQIMPKQVQTMRLSTQMLQSLEILSLPIFELQQKIEQELESNPALERAQESSEVSIEETFEKFDNMESAMEEAEWTDSAVVKAANELGTIIERTAISEHQTLHNSLIEQLRLQRLSDEGYQCGCAIINNLDDNGFHIIDPDIHPTLSHSPSSAKLIALIQTFEPWGVCVKDVRESLILQARLHSNAPECTHDILERFFVQLEKQKFAKIATAISIPPESVMQVYQYVRNLTPYPGKTINAQQTQFIIPDLEIRFINNSYIVAISERAYSKLRINKLFLTIDAAENKKDNQFIKSYRQQARSFMTTLKRRNQTLLRTAYALLNKQHRFFRLGPQYLQPLRLQDIADTLKVHETTVSRIASQKYMQTNWGIYPISYLFSNKVDSDIDGISHSKEGIKAVMKEMLTKQDQASNRLSDQQIADQLQQKGIRIARRTVTKYRNELEIPNAMYRRMPTDEL